MSLKKILFPPNYNYIACFLTFRCPIRCEYCINFLDPKKRELRKELSGREWIKAINRISFVRDVPITLQGGEPSMHPDFIWIINNISPRLRIDILTNLSFDVEHFIGSVVPSRLKRKAPYASIRVTYHPMDMDLYALISKVLRMKKAGFSIGVYGILHPQFKRKILDAQRVCQGVGIDFRTKEFLGEYEGKTFGSYRYPDAVNNLQKRVCFCRTTELVVGPNGDVFRCHHDLYRGQLPLGNLAKKDFEIKDEYRKCEHYGSCNPCDVKVKTNRSQSYGHVSVKIKDVVREASDQG